jgi:glutamate racemase
VRIGVFDSGVGGLTVLRALFDRIPQADYLYLGDTARLPYGSKSQATIARYAVESARFLIERGAQFLVIACNTASALALDEIRAAAHPVPVLGVIETGANAACASSQTRDVLVMATPATVSSHAYRLACRDRGLRALEKACPLLVPLVEEGWIDHPVTSEVLRIYLGELLDQSREDSAPHAAFRPDTLVLGCTHYPLLRPLLERTLESTPFVRAALEASEDGNPDSEAPFGSDAQRAGRARLRVIDSAEVTAAQVAERLRIPPPSANGSVPHCQFFATDSAARFRELGARFLAAPISHVEHIDLGG